MTYLLPLNVDYFKINSTITSLPDILSSHETLKYIKNWTSQKLNIPIVITTTHVAMTAITCIAIAALPKMVALGCLTISVFAYNRLAKMVKASESRLIDTLISQKVINSLSAPRLDKDVLTFIKDLRKNDYLAIDGINKKISEKHSLFNTKLNYLEVKLKLASKEGSDFSQIDSLDVQTWLINDLNQYIGHLQSVIQVLEAQEENPLKNKLSEEYSKLLLGVEGLLDRLQSLSTLTVLNQKHIQRFKYELIMFSSANMLFSWETTPIQKEHEETLIQQDTLSSKLKYLIEKLELASKMSLNFSQIDAIEDLALLMDGFSEYVNDLKQNKQALENQKESFLKSTYTELLTNAESLYEKLQALEVNRFFFKENGALFIKIANIFFNIDLNIINKKATCRNFMFYSLTGTMLFKLGCFLKVASNANWADAIIINQHLGHPYIIMGLSGLAAIYAVKNALKLIGHRNDEAKKHELLSTITEDEYSKLNQVLATNS